MQDKPNKPELRPADIAREAFRRLAAERIAPTPDAYRKVYDEIAGTVASAGAETLLAGFAAHLATLSDSASTLSTTLVRALDARDWERGAQVLATLVDEHLRKPAAVAPAAPATQRAVEERVPLLAAGEAAVGAGIDPSRTRRAQPFPLVDAAPAPAALAGSDSQLLRDLLARALSLGVVALLRGAPELAEEAEALAKAVRDPKQGARLDEIASRLKRLCFKIELRSDDMAEEHELLLRLFRLLLENVGELLEDDAWLTGQLETVQALVNGPINHAALLDATRRLKDVIYKQGVLKHSLGEAKAKVKNMMITFIDRLGAVATSTGDYHMKIGQYSQKIGNAKNITELNSILDDVMQDTRSVQTQALRSRDEMVAARKEVQEAESKIAELETKLEQMSELVREDTLTGSLNRRGLDDVFEREFARAERRSAPLCIALLDLDDFKRLNDTYGHSAGDEALIHLVRVVKETLRTMDVIGRFGGEEFLIVLPDTALDAAMQTVTRVQRELTKRIFMHEHAKLLITFSAGVALRAPGEGPAHLIERADSALYKAKKAGKNRVVAAD